MKGKSITVTLPDGVQKQYPLGTTLLEIAKEVDFKSAGPVVAGKIDGRLVDLSTSMASDCSAEIVVYGSPEGKSVYWHSTSHILAQAVKELFPEAKLGIGPPIENGFYYDFDVRNPFSPEDLEKIEQRMRQIIKADLPFQRKVVLRAEALELFASKGEDYKVELVQDMGEEEQLILYQHGGFVDLCRGPHLPSTGYVKVFKLLSSSGAYWRGDESNPMLQRIYGISFDTQEELERYLERLAEIERRDHRRLGKELDLFSVHDEGGAGLIHWHPKGGLIRTLIEDFWRQEHYKAGYDIVYSPHIGKSRLWETSGHLDFYRENMYSPMDIEGQEYFIRPMNCPFHIMIYKSRKRSYRDLPLRWAELGTVYRYERSGVLHGLLRVRGFTQDDAHIFCRPDQVKDEIMGCLNFALHFLHSFGFKDYEIALSVRDSEHKEKYIGDDSDWEMAEGALAAALEQRKLSYIREEGEAVFYGPKIDIKIKDALGRDWQCTTIQFDFNLPERFDMSYVGEDSREHRPYMVHRALLGSLERFFGALIEHYAGAFPLWLAPVQAIIIPITDDQTEYAERIAEELKSDSIRVSVDQRNEKVGHKIRDAELQKIPYMLIVGQREVQAQTVSLRKRGEGDLGSFKIEELQARITDEIHRKV